MAKAGDKKLVIILIVLFVVAFAVIAALCYHRWNANAKLQEEIESIKLRITKQEKRKARIKVLQEKKSRIVEAINQLTRILPTETQASHQQFLKLLRGFEKDSKIVVRTLLPPKEETNLELRIKRYKYNILLVGEFPQFVQFLNLIERHERFFKVDSFELANERLGADYWPADAEKKIKLQITTYTYNPLE